MQGHHLFNSCSSHFRLRSRWVKHLLSCGDVGRNVSCYFGSFLLPGAGISGKLLYLINGYFVATLKLIDFPFLVALMGCSP